MGISIRTAREEDLSTLVELYNQYILTTSITFDLSPYTIEERRSQWFEHYSETGRYRLLVAICEAQAVGYVSSSPFATKAAYQTSVETSIYLSHKYRGKGIGSRLYASLFDLLTEEDVHRAYAGITLPNQPSIALHRKFGFEQAGIFREVGRKFDQYWDVAWYEKRIG